MDVPNWKETNSYQTNCSVLANFTSLNDLPVTEIEIIGFNYTICTNCIIKGHVILGNKLPQSIALMVKLRITAGKNGGNVNPILWEDNYFSLMPD